MSEIDRLVALGDANAILDELQQRTTEWDDAREALDRLIDGSAQVIAAADVDRAGIVRERDALRGEVVRLRGQLAMHLTAWRNARDRARLWRGRAVRAYTTLAEARQEAEKARADAANQREFARDGHAIAEQASALHRDARAELEQVHAALDTARGRLEEESAGLAVAWQAAKDYKVRSDRYRLAWQSARSGRAEARANLAVVRRNWQALSERVSSLAKEAAGRKEHAEKLRADRDRLAEQVRRVRALHPKRENPTSGCCAHPKVCTKPHPPVCNGASHGLNRPTWPCAEIRAIEGEEETRG